MLKAIVVSLKIPYCVHYILANWAFNTNGIHAAGEGGVKQEYQGCLFAIHCWLERAGFEPSDPFSDEEHSHIGINDL